MRVMVNGSSLSNQVYAYTTTRCSYNNITNRYKLAYIPSNTTYTVTNMNGAVCTK